MDNIKLGIIGLGFVGGAIMDFFIESGKFNLNHNLFVYDKYKNNGIGKFDENILDSDILFLALPTVFNEKEKKYDISSIEETLEKLKNHNFKKTVILKSTVIPTTTDKLSIKYKINIIHNPEFLTARTANIDFKEQQHIVLGQSEYCNKDFIDNTYNFFKTFFPHAKISVCSAKESESMKIFLNNFYAVKVQFFTEIYLLCNKLNIDYTNVKDLMLNNNWINPMHTQIPGPDGNISYGGLCFPKDTNALLNLMKDLDVPNKVIEATILERNSMRNDVQNISF